MHEKRICPLCKSEVLISEKHEEDSPFTEIYAANWREGAVKKLVSDLKYNSVRACAKVLAELMDECIPKGLDVTVVPLPTIGKHIRERGLDHTLLIAKRLAKIRGWKIEKILGRATDSVQVGTKAAKRREQAAATYEVVREIDPETEYLLFDDVWTTGASMLAAAGVMQKAGAKKLRAAVVAVSKD